MSVPVTVAVKTLIVGCIFSITGCQLAEQGRIESATTKSVSARIVNPWEAQNIPKKVEISLSQVGLNSIANWTGCRASGGAGDPMHLAEQILSDGWSHLSFLICLDNYFHYDWKLKTSLVRQKARAMKEQIAQLSAKFPDKVFVLIAKSRLRVGGWSHKGINTSYVYEAFETKEVARKAYYEMWNIWADELKEIPADTLVFGIMNEPEFHKRIWGADQWAEYASQIISNVRSISPDRVILFEGIRKSVVGRKHSPSSMSKILPFKKIVYGFHFYEPSDWTHRRKPGGLEPSSSNLSHAKRTMRKLQRFSQKNSVPVLLSEVGVWGPVFKLGTSKVVQGVSFEQRAKYANVIYENTIPFRIGITWWAVHDKNTPYGGSCCKMQSELFPDKELWNALRLNQ